MVHWLYYRSVLVPRGALADRADAAALDTPRPKPTPLPPPEDGLWLWLCGLPLRRDEGFVWSDGISAISCRRFCDVIGSGVRCEVFESIYNL